MKIFSSFLNGHLKKKKHTHARKYVFAVKESASVGYNKTPSVAAPRDA